MHPYWTNIDKSSDWYSNAQKGIGFIDLDLMVAERLPIDNHSAELVYCSHLLEHLPDKIGQRILREAYRILKPGGSLRVSTPDIMLEFRAFKERDYHYYSWVDFYSQPGNYEHIYNKPLNQATIQQLFVFRFASHVSTLHVDSTTTKLDDDTIDRIFSSLPLTEALNYCTSRCDHALQSRYPGNHISWWSFEKMRDAISDAGFQNVWRSGYGQSFAPPLRNTKLFDKTRPPISLYVEARK